MDVPEFVRTFHIRAPQAMWFLGAGASAAARIPTAGAMIWDFKRRIYCAAQRVQLETCRDLGSAELRHRLQAYFDGLGGAPGLGDPDEYAHYFESLYPDDGDRRRYIERLVEDGTPSFGHHALAGLMASGLVRVVWTTNFDRVVEDAAGPALAGHTRLTVASLDAADIARDAVNEGRWPALIKLHGDFQSRRLKNTRDELRQQDAVMRRTLLQACRSMGMVVVGYSGRDDSIMRVFEDALEEDGQSVGAFPAGLFWVHRSSDGPPAVRVQRLIERARSLGVAAHVVEVETFDELLGDVIGQLESPSDTIRSLLGSRPTHVTDAPIPPSGNAYPVVRLNAVPISDLPKVCRRIECDIGNTSAVRDAVTRANANLIVGRRKVGVLAFGPDDEVRRVFAPFNIKSFDLHPLESRRLFHADSVEMGMLLEALARSLERERPLKAVRRRGRYILPVDVDRADRSAPIARLRKLTGQISGRHTVPTAGGEKVDLAWTEAVTIRMEQRLGRLWLLLEPTIWIERGPDKVAVYAAADFVRERRARRYNSQASELLDAWVDIVTDNYDEVRISAFGLSESSCVDANFTIARAPAFSRAHRGGREPRGGLR